MAPGDSLAFGWSWGYESTPRQISDHVPLELNNKSPCWGLPGLWRHLLNSEGGCGIDRHLRSGFPDHLVVWLAQPEVEAPNASSAAEASSMIPEHKCFWKCCICKVLNKMPRIKGYTCRALILLWTFSWDKTLAGSASVWTSSARKMLSWDNARDPIIPWEHLSEQEGGKQRRDECIDQKWEQK